jgi:hypothetical protein
LRVAVAAHLVAGFDQNAAEAACKHLKRNDIACMAIKN